MPQPIPGATVGLDNGASASDLGKSLGADSLAFISVEGLLESLETVGVSIKAGPERSYCLGCFTGEYPIPVAGEKGE